MGGSAIYIAVSGVHGIGKSLVCRMLAKRSGWEFSPEVVNTIISPPRFGPRGRNKLLSELWHMRQLMEREEWLKRNKDKVCIVDRWWQDVLVYSKVLLTPKEFRLIENIVSWIPKENPDLEIVLWAPDDYVFKRIAERGRDKGVTWGEKELSYLRQVNTGFRTYYDGFKDIRRLELVEAQPVIESTYKLVKRVVSRYVHDQSQRTLGEFKK